MPNAKTPPLLTLFSRAAILAGPCLMMVGLFIYAIFEAVPFKSLAILGMIAFGAVLFLYGVLSNLGWLWNRIRRKRFMAGLNVWATVVLALLLLIIANTIVTVMPQTKGWRMDCTATRVHTLSEKTLNILSGLTEDVRITVLVGSGALALGNEVQLPVLEQIEDLTDLYDAASRRVTVDIIHVYREQLRTEQFRSRIGKKIQSDTILVECGDRVMGVRFQTLFDLTNITANQFLGVMPPFVGEEKISTALLKTSEGKPPLICFLTGHGEPPLDGEEPDDPAAFAAALLTDNYRVELLNPAQNAVPEDCELIVIVAPTGTFQQEEIQALTAFLEKGGAFLVLLKPAFTGARLGRLDTLLKLNNVLVRPNHTVADITPDIVTGKGKPNLAFAVLPNTDHPITQKIKTENCVFWVACPVEPLMPEPEGSGGGIPTGLTLPARTLPLLYSGPTSWGETNLAATPLEFTPGQDEPGPLSLAVAVETRKTASGDSDDAADDFHPARLVVVGAAAIAGNFSLQEYSGNRTFLLNSVAWLLKRESRLGIAPRQSLKPGLNRSPDVWRRVFYLTVLGMPFLCVLLGGAVWWIRSRN